MCDIWVFRYEVIQECIFAPGAPPEDTTMWAHISGSVPIFVVPFEFLQTFETKTAVFARVFSLRIEIRWIHLNWKAGEPARGGE